MTLLGRAFNENASQNSHIPGGSFLVGLPFCRCRELVCANYHVLKRGLSGLRLRRRSAQACAQRNPQQCTDSRVDYDGLGMHLTRMSSATAGGDERGLK